jgi:hypothetical protein
MDDDRVPDLLLNEIALVHWSWSMWRKLYLEERHRKILEKAAWPFFYQVQQVLLDHVFVSLSRLVDPPMMAGHENLTLERLLSHPKVVSDPAFQEEAKQKVEAARAMCGKMRAWRNKSVAHLDEKTMLAGPLNVLPPVSPDEVEGALSALAHAFNAIQAHLYDGNVTTAFDQTFSPPGDAESLLQCLRYAAKWKTLQECLLAAGEYEGGLSNGTER